MILSTANTISATNRYCSFLLWMTISWVYHTIIVLCYWQFYVLPCCVMNGNKWFQSSLVRLCHLSILCNDLSNRVSFRWTCFETCCMVRKCIVATLLLSQTKCINFKNVVYWNANIFPFEFSSAGIKFSVAINPAESV